MLIAVPSDPPGGLDAPVSAHFGHCAAFTLVPLDEGELGEATIIANEGHVEGGCMMPVQMLKSHGVEILMAGGMGMRPLAGFRQVGIEVFNTGGANTVREALDLMAKGRAAAFGSDHTCSGGGGGDCEGHDHHHAPVEREPVDGVADVQKNRVISIDYQLTNKAGEALDSSTGQGPMQYLHGHDNIVPGLEKALAGMVVGDKKTVEVPAAEAYGAVDPKLVITVPRAQIPPDAKIGTPLRAMQPNGQVALLTVVALDDNEAKLDANHPLAGEDLVFDVTIVKVEKATDEELAHGHVH